MASCHRLEFVLARLPHEVVAVVAGFAAPQAPGRAFLPAGRAFLPGGVLKIPFSLDQIAHAHVDAEAAAEFSGAARIWAQCAALDQHRAFELDPFDRAVAHVALAHRYGRGFAVFRRAATP